MSTSRIQDPAQLNSWNVVGRWYYGPLFWPIFPAMYALPSGAYGDETITPESYHDTPTVNGVAYPTLDVDPTAFIASVSSTGRWIVT